VTTTSRPWLRILLYQDLPGRWMARSLEHDIAIEGLTRDTALDSLLRIIGAHAAFDERHGRGPLATFPEAPQRFWRAFEHATPIGTVGGACGVSADGSDRSILIAFTLQRPPAAARWFVPLRREAPASGVPDLLPRNALSFN
jgi:hypothetical protein